MNVACEFKEYCGTLYYYKYFRLYRVLWFYLLLLFIFFFSLFFFYLLGAPLFYMNLGGNNMVEFFGSLIEKITKTLQLTVFFFLTYEFYFKTFVL